MKAPSIIKTFLLITIALFGWAGLMLQLYIIMQSAIENNVSIAAELLRYFSYFTILTNLLVALCATIILLSPGSGWGRFFSKAAVQSGIALYILVVGLVYTLALRHIWDPEGLQRVADHILHDIIPVFYILYWAFFVPKYSFTWRLPLWWLLYPLVYLVYVMIRGALMDVYPYYFIDRNVVAWPQLLINIALLFAAFAVPGFLMVGISRLFYQRPDPL